MNQDERCCGTGTCIINAEGRCWCGQQWNGTAMYSPAAMDATPATKIANTALLSPVADADATDLAKRSPL